MTTSKTPAATPGSGDAEAMRAYAVVRDIFGLERYGSSVEALDGKVAGETQVLLLLERLPERMNTGRKKEYNARLAAGQLRGIPARLARRYAALRDLEGVLDMAQFAKRLEQRFEQVGRAYFQIHEALHIPALQAATTTIACHTALENMAVLGLRDQLNDTLALLTVIHQTLSMSAGN